MNRYSQRGATLIELLISLSVLAIALSGTLAATTGLITHSNTPALRVQAIAIASAYLEEALAQDWDDPDGGENGSCEEASRANYDDLSDYSCIDDNGARDRLGQPITGLEGYRVQMQLSSGTLNGASARRLQVSVEPLALTGQRVQLAAWRVQQP